MLFFGSFLGSWFVLCLTFSICIVDSSQMIRFSFTFVSKIIDYWPRNCRDYCCRIWIYPNFEFSPAMPLVAPQSPIGWLFTPFFLSHTHTLTLNKHTYFQPGQLFPWFVLPGDRCFNCPTGGICNSTRGPPIAKPGGWSWKALLEKWIGKHDTKKWGPTKTGWKKVGKVGKVGKAVERLETHFFLGRLESCWKKTPCRQTVRDQLIFVESVTFLASTHNWLSQGPLQGIFGAFEPFEYKMFFSLSGLEMVVYI